MQPKKGKEMIKLSRKQLSIAIRCVTGHDFRCRHESITRGVDLGNCRLCDEAPESRDHLVNDCPRLNLLRADTFNKVVGEIVTPQWEVDRLVSFLQDPNISWLEDPVED